MKRRANALIILIIVYLLSMIFIAVSIYGPLYKDNDFDSALLPENSENAEDSENAGNTENAGNRDNSADSDNASDSDGTENGDIDVDSESSIKTTLLINNSAENASYSYHDGIAFVISDMKISFDSADLQNYDFSSISAYQNVIINVSDFSSLDPWFDRIKSFVEDGGSILFIRPPHISKATSNWADFLGIKNLYSETELVDSIRPYKSFMIGGGQNYIINSTYNTAVKAELYGDTDTLATTKDAGIPIIWQKKDKDGRVVVLNFPDFSKAVRGIYASAISCLGDYSVYPVIDSSTYYLDDFPAPVSSESTEKLTLEYGLAYDKFISDIWWPDVTELSKKHDIKFTGMLIETYADITSGDLPRNRDTDTFSYYGNMLLASGGEIGIHGYNHQPLCGPGFEYKYIKNYNLWTDKAEMEVSLNEVMSFAEELYPGTSITTYVPPSNILSDDGRDVLGENKLGIRTIASVYSGNEESYNQEFCVSPDGIIETPRIVSGELINDYQKLMAMSELNMHFVNTHFMHPDDILDSDRTGEATWEDCLKSIDSYMTWVDDTAPDIRHLTASGLAGAVQRFSMAKPSVIDKGDAIEIKISGFTDESFLFIRINNGREPANMSGGEYEQLTDNLYLLKCDSDDVNISFK